TATAPTCGPRPAGAPCWSANRIRKATSPATRSTTRTWRKTRSGPSLSSVVSPNSDRKSAATPSPFRTSTAVWATSVRLRLRPPEWSIEHPGAETHSVADPGTGTPQRVQALPRLARPAGARSPHRHDRDPPPRLRRHRDDARDLHPAESFAAVVDPGG